MSQCANGTRVKDGAPAFVWLTWNAFVAWVSSKLGRLGYFTWLVVPDVLQEVEEFCATEPVIPDPPSAATWALAIVGWPDATNTVTDYLWSLFKSSIWPTVCECVPDEGGGGGDCGSLFTRPFSSLPNSAFNGSTVYDLGMKFHAEQAASVTKVQYRDISGLGGQSVTFKLWDLTGSTLLWSQVVSGITDGYHEFDCTTVTELVAGRNYAITFRFLAGANCNTIDTGYAGGTGAIISGINRIDNYPSGAGTPSREFSGAGIAIGPIACLAPAFVPPDPDDPTDIPDYPGAPTCSTTADICARLLQIEARLRGMQTSINWTQDVVAPAGYVQGASHNVSSSGTLNVSDIVGVLVESSVPAMWQFTADDPPRYIPKVGAIHFGDSVAPQDELQVHYAVELFLGAPPLTHVVAYSFRQGVTATITELERTR